MKRLLIIFMLSFSVQAKVNVQIRTNAGDINLELDDARAPVSVENFLDYARNGFYDGTIFHRVIKGFVIQGGGFDTNGNPKKTRAPIINEADNGLSNLSGTIAMARTLDPDSATSQFYINLVDNKTLDYSSSNPGYAVFGKVVSGFDVVQAIGATLTNPDDSPQIPIIIEKVKVYPAE